MNLFCWARGGHRVITANLTRYVCDDCGWSPGGRDRGGVVRWRWWRRPRRLYYCECGCGRTMTAAYGWDGYHGPDFDRPATRTGEAS